MRQAQKTYEVETHLQKHRLPKQVLNHLGFLLEKIKGKKRERQAQFEALGFTWFPTAKTFNKGLRIFPNHPHSPTPGFSIPKLPQDQLFWYPPLFFLTICYLTHSQLHYYSPNWFCAGQWQSLYLAPSCISFTAALQAKLHIKKEGCTFTQVTHKPIHFELCIHSK